MAGGYYAALSGMRARQEALDRIASDIANVSTAGYKTERAGTVQADRPNFGAVLQSAVDTLNGDPKIDFRPGAQAATGRSLDLAIEGEGFFAIETPQGPRYTRNGHFVRGTDGTLMTDSGEAVQGSNGPITLGEGEIAVEADGTVRAGKTVAGTINVVTFPPGTAIEREGASRFRTEAQPEAVARPIVRAGALEQSNVSMMERIAEMTEVSRSYSTLLRGVSVLMNDVDSRAISELGKR